VRPLAGGRRRPPCVFFSFGRNGARCTAIRHLGRFLSSGAVADATMPTRRIPFVSRISCGPLKLNETLQRRTSQYRKRHARQLFEVGTNGLGAETAAEVARDVPNNAAAASIARSFVRSRLDRWVIG
jgi:hypothetical protein